MSQFTPILDSLKTEPYSTKKQLLDYLLRMLKQIRKPSSEDRDSILAYAFDEVKAFLRAIPQTQSYREKDLIFACQDLVLGLIVTLCPSPSDIPAGELTKIQMLVKLVEQERFLETAIDRIFKQDSIEQRDMVHLRFLAGQTSDEYQKGRLYLGLIHYKDQVAALSSEVRAPMSAHLRSELSRYLSMDSRDGDCIENMELMADVIKYFADDELIELIYQVLELGNNDINYYATETLLHVKKDVPSDVITALARDLKHANLTHGLLAAHGALQLFPPACATEEYLAKSDLVHWLTYPTELGSAPDEIEYIGKITYLFRKEVYHVFKFRSDSDTLDEKYQHKWLIGWSGSDGGTFSNFDEYAPFERSTVKATLKAIKKNLIG